MSCGTVRGLICNCSKVRYKYGHMLIYFVELKAQYSRFCVFYHIQAHYYVNGLSRRKVSVGVNCPTGHFTPE